MEEQLLQRIQQEGEKLNFQFLDDNPTHWLSEQGLFCRRHVSVPAETFERTSCVLTTAAIRALWNSLVSGQTDSLVVPNVCDDEWDFQKGMTLERALQELPLFEVKVFVNDDYEHCFVVLRDVTLPTQPTETKGVLIQSLFKYYPVKVTPLTENLRQALCDLRDGDIRSLDLIVEANFLGSASGLGDQYEIGVYAPILFCQDHDQIGSK